MKKIGITVLLIALILLPALLLAKIIGLSTFFAIGTFWLLSALVLILGPETITEITFWKASVKRDVQAAKEIRDEVEQIREELRGLTKLIVEDAYILASCSFLAMGGEMQARTRLEKNLEELSKFAEPIKGKEDKWWVELEDLFAARRE